MELLLWSAHAARAVYAAHRLNPKRSLRRASERPAFESLVGTDLIAACQLLMGLGSGMAYKYIPIFCWKELGMPPVQTYALVGAFQLIATLNNFVVSRLARFTGPMGAAVLYILLAQLALGVVCVSYHTPTIIVALIVRGTLMNSVGGIIGSTLNDHIQTSRRARWNVVMQFGQVTWSGSAFAGGALADAYGYRSAFSVTVVLHTLSACCLAPLILLVPPEHLRTRK